MTGEVVSPAGDEPPIPRTAEHPVPATPRARRSGTFGALHNRNFRLFFTGQLISLVGVWVQQVALAWLVLDLTNSAWHVGLVNALESAPVLLLALYAGVLADRMSRHRLVVVTKAVSMGLALTLAALVFAGIETVWPIMVVALGFGIVNAFDIPARHTLFGDLVGRDQLMSAVALNSSSFNATRVVGPVIAGVILGYLGAAWCFLLNGISYIAVLAGLYRMDVPPVRVFAPREVSAWHSTREGLRYIWAEARLRTILLLLAVLAIFGSPFLVLLPVLARDVLGHGAVEYGWMMAAVGLGALAGALWVSGVGRRHRRGRLLTTSAAAYSVLVLVLALVRSLPLALVVLALLGFTMIVNGALSNTLLQTLAPDHLRGRIVSVYTLVAIGLAPLGAIQAGAIAETFSSGVAIGAGALVCLVATMLAGRVKDLQATK
jgi:MFS family permease